MRRTLLVLALAALAACSREQEPVRIGPIYSPNAEPLSGGPLGNPSCEDALGKWFDRLDATHSGAIDESQFLADASRQFAAMDLDKSGVLTPSELAQYRAPYIDPNEGRHDYDAGGYYGQGRGPPPQEDVEDPVMEADVTLQNRVTRDEFMAYEQRNFAALDADHDGRLERDEVLATCKQ